MKDCCAALLIVLLCVCGGGRTFAQVVPAASHGAGVATADDSDVPDPVERGWTASLDTSEAHDSLTGWSTLETPSAGYRWNEHFSADASVPFYAYVNAVRTGKHGDPRLRGRTAQLGDAAFAGHLALSPEICNYLATLAFTAPTGNEHLGLGTGHLGYDLNNHFDREMGLFDPDVELGIGNTSALLRRAVRKSYTSSGLLAFFQAGTALNFADGLSLDAEAYEQLPLSSQVVYSRAARKGSAVLTRAGDAEDNGVTVEFDAPLFARLLLTASYNRSIRLDESTEGLSLTFVLHRPGGH